MIKPIAIILGEPNSISSEIIFKSWIKKKKFKHLPCLVIGNYNLLCRQLKYFKFKEPFELHYNGELPARTGLGTSSAFTVGLCNIMNFIKKKKISKFNLAKEATYIEQKKIKD